MTGAAVVRALLLVFGLLALVSALLVVFGGPDANVDGESVGVSTDSELRFFNAMWAAFGGYIVWRAARGEIPRELLTPIVTLLFAGALGRVASWVAEGRPHGVYLFLFGVELLSPLLLLVQRR